MALYWYYKSNLNKERIMATFNAKCTTEQFEKIHHQLDTTRRTSETVKVNRADLMALLIDHGTLHAILHTGA
jgi:hypothetical protein